MTEWPDDVRAEIVRLLIEGEIEILERRISMLEEVAERTLEGLKMQDIVTYIPLQAADSDRLAAFEEWNSKYSIPDLILPEEAFDRENFYPDRLEEE